MTSKTLSGLVFTVLLCAAAPSLAGVTLPQQPVAPLTHTVSPASGIAAPQPATGHPMTAGPSGATVQAQEQAAMLPRRSRLATMC